MNSIRKGFTLVEILIVVIILGILAAIVIPQFTEASNDARESSLASDLQTLRSQVELYKIQHLDAAPGADADGVVDGGDLVTCLTSKTDETGAAGGDLGPYLQKMPSNPFIPSTGDPDGVAVAADAAAAATAAEGNATGWIYIQDSGRIVPGDSNLDHQDL